MKLVLVHGRGQPGQNRHSSQRLWWGALQAGFGAAGLVLPDELDVVFPYYGDLLFSDTDAACRHAHQRLLEQGVDATAPSLVEQRFVQDLVLDMALCKGITGEQLSRRAGGPPVQPGVPNRRVVLAALRLLSRLEGVDAGWLELFTRDAWSYLTRQELRMPVQDVLEQAIPEQEACVVVAHSLGSMVAYDLLMDRLERGHVKAFITLGSPLGIGAVVERLPTARVARRAPSGVGRWFNARDTGDLVALHDVPAVLFKGEPVVENYSGVHNNTANQHGVQDYLRDKIVARAIFDALHAG